MDLIRICNDDKSFIFGMWSVLLMVFQIQNVICTTPTDLRLVEGSQPYYGLAEVQIEGKWERVCQMGWNYRMANHLCLHLGFENGAMLPRSDVTVPDVRSAIPKVSCYLTREGVVDCKRTHVSCSVAAGVTCNFPGYLGCYDHTKEKPITDSVRFNNESMTIEKCLEFCRMGKYKYSGLAFGKECLCDDKGPSNWYDRKTENVNCMLPCRGDVWETCGGPAQARMYETRVGTCGGKLKPSDAYIASPLFPNEYERGSICTWKVISDDPRIESFTLNFQMMRLLPGDMIRITELESGTVAVVRKILKFITSDMVATEGTELNIVGGGFYVEFQSARITTGQGDPGFMIVFEPYFAPEPTTKAPIPTTPPYITDIHRGPVVTHIIPGHGNTAGPGVIPGTRPGSELVPINPRPQPRPRPRPGYPRPTVHTPFGGDGGGGGGGGGDGDDSAESTTPSSDYPSTTDHIPYKSNKLIASVATVGIGGFVVAFWGLTAGVMMLRKRMPLSNLKFARDDRPEITREGTSFYRSSFDSDTESLRSSFHSTDSTFTDTSEKTDISENTVSENTEPEPSDNVVTNVTLVHTTHVPNPSTTYFNVPRKSIPGKAARLKKASMVITSVVDHIYSSVYQGGRTVKHAKINIKPSISPKPDIVPILDRKTDEDNDGGYSPAFNGSMDSDGNVRFSTPLYQNIVKFNKSDSLNTENQSRDNTTPAPDVDSYSGLPLKGQGVKAVDNWGYLVPGGKKYKPKPEDDDYL